MAKNKRKKYYAVAKGHKAGIYNSWGDCKEQVDGYSRNQYKGFKTESEAKEYLQRYSDDRNTAPSPTSQDASNPSTSDARSTPEGNPRKRIRREDYGMNDYKQPKSTPTPSSTSTTSGTPYESGYYAYLGAENGDDPVRDYYHYHGFYGY